MPFSYLVEPRKRIHILYLCSSAIIAYWVYRNQKTGTSILSYFFPKRIWLSGSAFVDYAMLFFNAFIKVLLIGPFLIYGLYIAYWVNEYLDTYVGYQTVSLSVAETLLYYTLAITIIGDFATFITHYILHRVPILWEFHKIHHSATALNPITQYRIHPVELILNNARGMLVFGVMTGIFDYMSRHQVSQITFIGVNVFSFAFLFLGANLRHSHVKLRYFNWLEYVFISPFQHQIHHSNEPRHHHKNFGAKFAIWDWIFGTLLRSRQMKSIKFGLGKEDSNYDSFLKNLYMPFKASWGKLISRIL